MREKLLNFEEVSYEEKLLFIPLKINEIKLGGWI